MQNYLVHKATEILSDELRTKVQIASVDIPFFNKISLNGLYLEDRQGDTLLYANRLKAGFSIRQLFKNRLVCRNVELKEPHIYLSVDTNNVSNLQFLIDTFKSDKPSSSTMTYKIEDISIIDAVFRFDNHNFPRKANGFDARHVFVKDFSTKLALHELNKESFSFEIQKLRLKEQSGIELKDLVLSITANKRNATVSRLSLRMPQTDLSFDTIRISYDSITALKKNWKNILFDFKIKPSNITPVDLKAFSPLLEKFKEKLFISTNFKGSLSNMKIRNFSTSYDNSFLLNGDFEFSGLPNLQETFIYANIKNIETNKAKIQDLVSELKGEPFILPDQLKNLGKIQYKGKISGLMDNLVAYGTLHTNAGFLSVDIMIDFMSQFEGFEYSGKLQANKLRPYIVLGDSSSFKELSFNLASKGKVHMNGDFEGDVNGNISSINFRDYQYSNVSLKGNFNKKIFEGNIALDDPNAKFLFQGVVDVSKGNLSGEFSLNITHLNLNKLHLIKSYPDLGIACNIKTNFSAQNFDSQTTELLVDNVWLSNNDEKYFLKKIHLKSTVSDSTNIFTIDSHLMQGIIKGEHYFRDIKQSFGNMLGQYISQLTPKQKSGINPKANNFVFYFSNFNLNSLAEFFNIDFEVSPYSSIAGFYNDTDKKFRMEVSLPYLKKGKIFVNNFYLLCNNNIDKAIDLFASTRLGKETKLQLESRIANDSVLVNLNWNNTDFVGTLAAVSFLRQNNAGNPLLDINLIPTEMWIKNTEWNIHEGKILTDLKTVNISSFSVKSNDKYIDINGIASASIHDSLTVELRKIPLYSIMNLVGVNDPKMESEVSGKAVVYSALKEMMLNLNLDAKSFTFNNSLWGDVKAKSHWDQQDKVLYADFLISKTNDTVASLKGSYRKDSLDFYVDARQLPLDFLRYYLDSSVKNISGTGTGKVRLFGSFKRFKMDGDVMVKNGQFDIDYLKTSYQFSDVVHLKPTEIRFDNIQVFDKNKNSGSVTGRITHNSFKDMRFNFNIACKNLMAMNTTAKDNPDFYGKIYATGTVQINGNSDQISFNINAKSEPNTRVVLPMQGSGNTTENSFIKYVSKDAVVIPKEGIIKSSSKKKDSSAVSKTVLKMAIQLEATPDAAIVLIIDPFSGDSVRATGSGNLRMDYASNADMKLSGNYVVEKGSYVFSLQEVIRKPFIIKQGSSLNWSGNPSHPIVNINAIYTVPSVSLANILDPSDLEGLSRSSVPVNCLLTLTGDLMQPNIKFDIEIPSEAEVERRVKAVINTDELMNREILALLVTNQFYRPDYLASTSNSNFGMSLLASTLSGQLNNMLGQLGDKFNIGLNAQVTNDNVSTNTEYDVAFQYQPNNRLIITSNVGYHSNTATTNSSSSNFTGDLDVEYKLTKSGKWRAKVYTHSADNNYYDTNGDMKMTQGVGIMYREDFNKFSEVIRNIFSRKQKIKNDSIK